MSIFSRRTLVLGGAIALLNVSLLLSGEPPPEEKSPKDMITPETQRAIDRGLAPLNAWTTCGFNWRARSWVSRLARKRGAWIANRPGGIRERKFQGPKIAAACLPPAFKSRCQFFSSSALAPDSLR